MADDGKRYIPPGSCTWCGHAPHASACSASIRTGTATSASCPCGRAAWYAAREVLADA